MRLPLLATLMVLSGACAPDAARVDFCPYTALHGSTLDATGIRIPEGTAVAVKLVPYDDEGDPLKKDREVSIFVDDPSVLGAHRVQPGEPVPDEAECDGPEDAPWYFVFYGVSPGQTRVSIAVDRWVVVELEAVVEPPWTDGAP